MKQKLTLLFLMLTFFANAQYFGKQYPYWSVASSDAVIPYDDGYAILGYANTDNNDSYLFIIRTDLNGDTLWTKQIFESMGNSNNFINALTQDSDGNIYVAPYRYTDSADLIKLSADFEVLWMRKFDPQIDIKNIIISKDHNLLLSGKNTLNEHRLYKMDTAGNILWQSAALPHHHPQLWLSSSPSLIEMDDNSIILVSILSNFIGTLFCDMYSFSQNGDTISLTNFEWILSDVIADGNELIGIVPYHDGTGLEGNLLVRFQPDGTILWSHALNFAPQNISLYTFIQNIEGELIAAGRASSGYGQDTHIVLHGMSAAGDSLWTSLSIPSIDIWPYDISICSDGGYAVTGTSEISGERVVPFLLKTDAWGTLSVNKPNIGGEVSVYPNPAREKVAFETPNSKSGIITITDIFGRTVDEVMITGKKTIWNSEKAASGTYFYQINDGKQVSSGKFLIVK